MVSREMRPLPSLQMRFMHTTLNFSSHKQTIGTDHSYNSLAASSALPGLCRKHRNGAIQGTYPPGQLWGCCSDCLSESLHKCRPCSAMAAVHSTVFCFLRMSHRFIKPLGPAMGSTCTWCWLRIFYYGGRAERSPPIPHDFPAYRF